jgi:hypothetical protein
MKDALRSFETTVLTRAARRNIPEDGNLHSHRRQNLKSYVFTQLISPERTAAQKNAHNAETSFTSFYKF